MSGKKVLVVGAGLTGSAINHLIRKRAPGIAIEVWDKSRRAGGRATTSRIGESQVDLGLQYLSPSSIPQGSLYEELITEGVLVDLKCRLVGMNPKYASPDQKHFVCPLGSISISEYFLKDSEIMYSQTVTSISKSNSNQWEVKTEAGHVSMFDCVVLTMPTPQILNLSGDIQKTIAKDNIADKLAKVSYSSRFALALQFDTSSWAAFDELGWDVRYVSRKEDEAVCYMAVDQKKRGGIGSDGPVLMLHSNVPWSLGNNANVPKESEPADLRENVQSRLLTSAATLLPNILSSHPPIEVKLHKWRFSQVHHPYDGQPEAIEIVDNEGGPLLILAGDAYIGSNLENCLKSAERAFQIIAKSHL
eukprot:m.111613 g.111613  ORF g.111613 m.111613 type:complete len:361 (-) comp14064_c0_seq3:965-2047(-)